MEFVRQSRFVWIASLLLVIGLALSACAPDATARIITPALGPALVADEIANRPDAAPVEEEVVLTLADLSDEDIYAGFDPAIADAAMNADMAAAETLSLANGCTGCHNLDPDVVGAGPTWYDMGDTAVNRIKGVSPADYLYQSIVATNDYVVDGFTAGIMPQTFGDTLSDEDIGNLVGYLLSQQGD